MHLRLTVTACLLACAKLAAAQGMAVTEPAPVRVPAPEWAFPVNPPQAAQAPAAVTAAPDRPVHVPHSSRAFLPEQLNDLFYVPDWHPEDHLAMPAIVARGRRPAVYACGYCHLPDGAGRPENARIAGLSADYIIQQLNAFKRGTRRTAVAGRAPAQSMAQLASAASDAEIYSAAAYFSRLQPRARLKVVETATVPRTHVVGWILAIDHPAATEPIGERIIEVPEDFALFDHRDSRLRYIAYVPVGSVQAGAALVRSGAGNRAHACSACHGNGLHGLGNVPRLAGASPSYLVRRLIDIQSGFDTGAEVAPMSPVVAALSLHDMIDIAAYVAALP
jgi:cytochrome c553